MTQIGDRPAHPEPSGEVRFRDLIALAGTRRASIAKALALLSTSAIMSLAQPVIAGRVVDSVRNGSPVASLVIVLAVVFTLDAAAQGLGQFVLLRLGESVIRDLRTQMLIRLVRIRIPVLQEHRPGDLLSRVSTDTVAMRNAVSKSLVNLISGVFTVLAAIALMLFVSPELLLIVLCTFAIAAAALAGLTSRLQRSSQLAQHHTGQMNAGLERTLGAARTVKMSQAENREIQSLIASANEAYDEGVRVARLIATLTPVINLALTGSVLFVLLFGGIWATNGTITVGELTTILLLALFVIVPVGEVFDAIAELRIGMGAMYRINETLELDIEDATDDEPPAALDAEPTNGFCQLEVFKVEFRDVAFTYPDGTQVLAGVTLTLPPHGYTAVVGRSGAGKSTIFSLLCGFYRPSRGQILIDGTDITQIPLRILRSKIALMDQDAPMMHGTLRENLTYAFPTAPDDLIADVIERAGLASIMSRSRAGLNAEVGDRGISLSGGERQRVAFGRAILARPEIILLDEPTAMLDSATDRILAHEIRDMSATACVVVIAHRISTIEAASMVVMLDDGVIAAMGTDVELRQSSADYRRLLGELSIGAEHGANS